MFAWRTYSLLSSSQNKQWAQLSLCWSELKGNNPLFLENPSDLLLPIIENNIKSWMDKINVKLAHFPNRINSSQIQYLLLTFIPNALPTRDGTSILRITWGSNPQFTECRLQEAIYFNDFIAWFCNRHQFAGCGLQKGLNKLLMVLWSRIPQLRRWSCGRTIY